MLMNDKNNSVVESVYEFFIYHLNKIFVWLNNDGIIYNWNGLNDGKEKKHNE